MRIILEVNDPVQIKTEGDAKPSNELLELLCQKGGLSTMPSGRYISYIGWIKGFKASGEALVEFPVGKFPTLAIEPKYLEYVWGIEER